MNKYLKKNSTESKTDSITHLDHMIIEETEEMERWSSSRSIYVVFIIALMALCCAGIIIYKSIDLIL